MRTVPVYWLWLLRSAVAIITIMDDDHASARAHACICVLTVRYTKFSRVRGALAETGLTTALCAKEREPRTTTHAITTLSGVLECFVCLTTYWRVARKD
uniref:Putative secreted protein n=1 Tax=Anopheles darlingi TaxID=43151 RepID=A0A2M4D9C7_ANODA